MGMAKYPVCAEGIPHCNCATQLPLNLQTCLFKLPNRKSTASTKVFVPSLLAPLCLLLFTGGYGCWSFKLEGGVGGEELGGCKKGSGTQNINGKEDSFDRGELRVGMAFFKAR